MSSEPVPLPSTPNTALDTSSLSSQSPSLPLWDRLSTWASENKAVVYTIAGVAVVISGAGVVYYLSDSRKAPKDGLVEQEKKSSKKAKRKAKKDKTQSESKAVPDQPKEQGKLLLYCAILF